MRTLFDKAAEGYDRSRRQLVPSFDDFYGAAVESIPHESDAAIRVLDLGAGTGLLSALVARAFPHARNLASRTPDGRSRASSPDAPWPCWQALAKKS